MWSILSKALAILIIILLIPTSLVFASQDAIPGDTTYPIKRGLENVISSVYSVNSSTRAVYKKDLSQRRFMEAVTLIKKGDEKSTKSLTELVAQTQDAADSLDQVQDPVLKKQYRQNLAQKINEYKIVLKQQEIKRSTENVKPTPTPSKRPTVTAILSPTLTPTPSSVRTNFDAFVTPTPTPIPTSVITSIPPQPTTELSPTLVVTTIPEPTPETLPIANPIQDTVNDLNIIQDRLANIATSDEVEQVKFNQGTENNIDISSITPTSTEILAAVKIKNTKLFSKVVDH